MDYSEGSEGGFEDTDGMTTGTDENGTPFVEFEWGLSGSGKLKKVEQDKVAEGEENPVQEGQGSQVQEEQQPPVQEEVKEEVKNDDEGPKQEGNGDPQEVSQLETV